MKEDDPNNDTTADVDYDPQSEETDRQLYLSQRDEYAKEEWQEKEEWRKLFRSWRGDE
ncbi:MAG: hypothetical protein ACREJN_16165 [Nitrospiraceae bacterium]